MKLNEFQKTFLRQYAGGEFAFLIQQDEDATHEFHGDNPLQVVEDLGDRFARFMLAELSDAEDCDSAAEAEARVINLFAEMKGIAAAFQAQPMALAA